MMGKMLVKVANTEEQCTYANMLGEREGGRLGGKDNRSSIGSNAHF